MNQTTDERPKRRSELAAWYQSKLEAHAESGLSLRAFSEEHGIPLPSLYAWRRKLRLAREEPGPGFIEVAVESNPKCGRASAEYRLCFGTGAILELSRGFDPGEVANLLKLIQSC